MQKPLGPCSIAAEIIIIIASDKVNILVFANLTNAILQTEKTIPEDWGMSFIIISVVINGREAITWVLT